jgi:hypothetical protein
VHCGQSADQPSLADLASLPSEPPPTSPEPNPDAAAPLFSAAADSADRALTGISGWLILVGLSLVVTPLRLAFALATVYPPYLFGTKHQDYLSRHPGSAALIAFEIVTHVVFVITLLALDYLFFKKKRGFPTFMILYLVSNFLTSALDHFAVRYLHPNLNHLKGDMTLLGTFLSLCIWIPYFLVSRRVKLTFVN